MTTNTEITDQDIRALKIAAGEHGDLSMAMTCDLALYGVEALEGAEPGTEADLLLSKGRTKEWARARCAEVIAYARGEADRGERLDVTERQTQYIAFYMDPEVRERCHDAAPCTPNEWLANALDKYPTETREAALLAGVKLDAR